MNYYGSLGNPCRPYKIASLCQLSMQTPQDEKLRVDEKGQMMTSEPTRGSNRDQKTYEGGDPSNKQVGPTSCIQNNILISGDLQSGFQQGNKVLVHYFIGFRSSTTSHLCLRGSRDTVKVNQEWEITQMLGQSKLAFPYSITSKNARMISIRLGFKMQKDA